MAKRLKLKLSRVIPSFQSCRSKDPSTLPSNPAPSFLLLSPVKEIPTVNFHHLPPPSPPPRPSNPGRASVKRHVSLALASIACGCCSSSSSNTSSSTSKSVSHSSHTATDRSRPPPEFHWQKEDKWHVIAKIHDKTDAAPRQKIYYNSSASNDDVLPPTPIVKKKKRQVGKKRPAPRTSRVSASSADSGLFSGFDENQVVVDDKELETETLVSSSRSFSTDSDFDINNRRRPPSERCASLKAKTGRRRRRNRARKSDSATGFSPARLSRWLVPCAVEGKLRESFAVVKRSEDPYKDFKLSMVEMVLEKEMFEAEDLEQLLHCFLSLNSRHHHRDIVRAFSDIWDALVSTSTTLKIN